MKKVVLFLLATVLVMSLVACQPNGPELAPTDGPTNAQTDAPTDAPTDVPTDAPTDVPTNAPTDAPTDVPTDAPTDVPTDAPTNAPTDGPTDAPTDGPTSTPTKAPTNAPTNTPTKAPTATAKPTTAKPTTAKPTTAKPTATPTAKPGNPYSPVSKVTIANDAVKSAVNLDSKVPQNLKAAYNTVKTAFSKENVSSAGKKTVDLTEHGLTVENVMDVIYYAQSYNPHLFFVDWNHVSYTTSGSTGKVKSVTLNCTSAVSQYDAVMAKAKQIVTEANKKPNLFERELYIHDWLVKNIKYDKTTDNCANMCGALMDGKALCEGYSRTFQYLMNQIGIETVLITGYAGEGHMWNMIKLYGDYYFVDVTHDDPTPDKTIGAGEDYLIGHSCFNISTSIIGKTHTIDAKGSRSNGFLRNADLQTCTKTTYHFYTIKGTAVSNLNQMKYVLYENKDLKNVEVYFTGTMPSIEDIKAAVVEFIKATYPGKGYSYSWTSETSASVKRNCIRISWTIK